MKGTNARLAAAVEEELATLTRYAIHAGRSLAEGVELFRRLSLTADAHDQGTASAAEVDAARADASRWALALPPCRERDDVLATLSAMSESPVSVD